MVDPRSRVIRVFVSSTFRDMQAERDELVKRIFPELRKRCEERGITWVDVDLRWGIPDEERAEGRVLPTCLAEIQSCRPYFIALLGERYGWVPDGIAPELVTREPWLAEHRERSITELEIIHGVLRNPHSAAEAFFYFRDPAFIDSLPPDQQSAFREVPPPEALDGLGRAAARGAAARRQKLVTLKQRIRSSGFPIRENYPNPIALGDLVRRDFTDVIDRLYPEGQVDVAARESAAHEAFAARHTRVYVASEADYRRLDAHVDSDDPPLVVAGEEGSGKSALLVNWAARHRAAHPDRAVVEHYVGASVSSSEWIAMLEGIVRQLWTPVAEARMAAVRPTGQLMLMYQASPAQKDALIRLFGLFLARGVSRRVVVLIDGLDHLEDRDGALDLTWLPRAIPPNIRMIVSTGPGRPRRAVSNKGWRSLDLGGLNRDERATLIAEWLAQFRKALPPAQLGQIADAAQTANPLFLRALLDELRMHGQHETIGERIRHYLDAATTIDLYQKILERYEADYERDRPGLVGEAMSLLWGARRGLTEMELLDLLGADGEPLPRAVWSPLFLAAEGALINRSGLLGFSNASFGQAVRRRYLLAPDDDRAVHGRLAGYFAARGRSHRSTEELPWQLLKGKAWQGLADLLADPLFFWAAWGRPESTNRAPSLFPYTISDARATSPELLEYWRAIEANTPIRMVDAYRSLLDAPLEHIECVLDLDQLLADAGHLDAALDLRRFLVDQCTQLGDQANLARALLREADALIGLGDVVPALAQVERAEGICRQRRDRIGLEDCLQRTDRIRLMQRQAAASETQTSEPGEMAQSVALVRSLIGQAMARQQEGERDRALALLKEAEGVSRRIGDTAGLAVGLGNQGMILMGGGDLDSALAQHREAGALFQQLDDHDGLARSFVNQAMILEARGEIDEALRLDDQAERLFRQLDDPAGLTGCLIHRAEILAHRRSQPREALPLVQEAHQLAVRYGLTAQQSTSQTLLDSIRSRATFAFVKRPNPER